MRQLEKYGIRVSERVPHVIPPNPYNRFYLETKAVRSGHHIDFEGKAHLPEQGEPVIVDASATPPDGTPPSATAMPGRAQSFLPPAIARCR